MELTLYLSFEFSSNFYDISIIQIIYTDIHDRDKYRNYHHLSNSEKKALLTYTYTHAIEDANK